MSAEPRPRDDDDLELLGSPRGDVDSEPSDSPPPAVEFTGPRLPRRTTPDSVRVLDTESSALFAPPLPVEPDDPVLSA